MVDAPDQARIPAIAFPPCEIDCTYRYKFPQGSLPPPSSISKMGGNQPLGDKVSARVKRLPIKRKQALVPYKDKTKTCL